VSGSFDERGQLDIADGRIILCVGKKKSGKSVMSMVLFQSYPGDKVVIDVAGDDGPMGGDVIDLHGTTDTLPRKWPEHLRKDGRPMTLRYVPDPGSSTEAEDMDAVVGLALYHGRRQHHAGKVGCALLCHESETLAPVQKTQQHMRRALAQNRHYHLTLIMAGQRPMGIATKLLSNADLVYAFELLNPDDRERLGKTVGWNARDLSDAMEDLGRHEYLRFDSNEMKPEDGEPDVRLVHFPPLPEEVVRSVK
jgi:hypothetical protein